MPPRNPRDDGARGSSTRRMPTSTTGGPSAAGPGRQFHVPAPGAAPRSATPTRAPAPTPAAAPPRSPAAATPPRARTEPRPAQVPPARRPPEPPAPPAEPPRAKRPRRRRWLLLIPILLVVALLAGLFWAYSTFNRIEKVDLGAVLDPVAGDSVNYLLVGSDSRDELDPEGNSGVTGRRSDTLILLRTGPDGSSMMSIPRDLWVTRADTGAEGRVNGAYNAGPANLVQTIKDNLDVPINHYVEVGFASFVGLVDAVGGITIEVPHPAFDRASGLVIPEAGAVTLDGTQALAYARSRHYTEIIDGREVLEPTADLGRQQRQQLFLRTALAEVGSTRNPVTLGRVASAMSSQLIVDDGLSFLDAIGLVRKLGSSDPTTVILPTEGVRRGGQAVLITIEPDAQVALAAFR